MFVAGVEDDVLVDEALVAFVGDHQRGAARRGTEAAASTKPWWKIW